jgi:hypothetical protein
VIVTAAPGRTPPAASRTVPINRPAGAAAAAAGNQQMAASARAKRRAGIQRIDPRTNMATCLLEERCRFYDDWRRPVPLRAAALLVA